MRKKLFLVIFACILYFAGLNIISAKECWKICYDDECIYSKAHVVFDYEISGLSQCLINNSYSDDCYDNVLYTKVDNNFCFSDNYDENNVVSCGNDLLTDIPAIVPKTVHLVYLLLQIAVPVILVIFGTIDFIRAIISSKEDEIKKGQQTFIKRLFVAVIIFFIFSIVKLVVSLVNGDSGRGINNVMNCTKCLINNDKNCVK